MQRLRILSTKRETIERKARIRQIIFGMQDGLISIVSLMAAIAGATNNDRLTIILAGITAAIAGALSMGTGEFLSSKSEKEIFDFEKREGITLIEQEPYLAMESILESLMNDGLSRDAAYKIVQQLINQQKIFRQTFTEKVLGLGEAEITNPLQAAIVITAAFLLASLVPISPYLIIAGYEALFSSIILTSMTLFLIGVIKGKFAGLNVLISGFEFFAVAFSSALLGYFIGDIAGPLISNLT